MIGFRAYRQANPHWCRDRRHDLARQIEQLDAQIDGLVYELYGLTEEIGVVEGRLKHEWREGERRTRKGL